MRLAIPRIRRLNRFTSRSPISRPMSSRSAARDPSREGHLPASDAGATSAQASPCVRFEAVAVPQGGDGRELRGVSFAFAPGSLHCLLGAPGLGKSAVLRLIALMQAPTRGRVQVLGRDVATLGRRDRAHMRRRIGALAQTPGFVEHLSARDNIGLAARALGRPAKAFDGDLDQLLAWIGLARRGDARPADLSGAERRRLALARAVVNRPEIILADEPTEDLDAPNAARMLRLLADLHGAGAAVIIATRDTALVTRLGQGALHLQDGRASLLEAASLQAGR